MKNSEENQNQTKNVTIIFFVALAASAVAVILLNLTREPPYKADSDSGLRIISLAPNATEMIFALDKQHCLVAVTNGCDYPPEAKDIECIGGFGPASIEKVLALAPDYIIAEGMPEKKTFDMLSKTGIEFIDVEINNVQQMFDKLLLIGKATGASDRANAMILEMQGELIAIQEKHKDIKSENRPTVFIEIWNDPMTSAGSNSFIDDVINLAGGVNAARSIEQAYPQINPEVVIEWNPDVIISCPMSPAGNIPEQIAGRIGWENISAVKHNRIVVDFPNDLILRSGPRVIEGIKLLADYLHNNDSDKKLSNQIDP